MVISLCAILSGAHDIEEIAEYAIQKEQFLELAMVYLHTIPLTKMPNFLQVFFKDKKVSLAFLPFSLLVPAIILHLFAYSLISLSEVLFCKEASGLSRTSIN